MVVQTRLDTMYQMRQSGATLDRVGSRFGITRERVRKLLTKHYGSTRVQDLLTAIELARLASCGYSYIDKLKRHGVIQPAMVVGRGRTLWKPETIATVTIYIDRHRCPLCQQPLSSARRVYCSREHYLEARRRYRAKKSRERYQTAQYVIRKKCLIPLGTVVRVLTADRERLKVVWGEQIVEIPSGCVKRIVKEAVTAS